MECYVKYHENRAACQSCAYVRHCRASADPPLLSRQARNIDIDQLESTIPAEEPTPVRRHYSQADLFEVIGFLTNLDLKTLDLLGEKLNCPQISCDALGRKRNISRQAIHKFIRNRCEAIPELAEVMLKYRQRQQTNKSLTFMEAVCRIQKQTSELKSKEPEADLTLSLSLISLNRSLDLSRMSIGKGVR